MKINMRTLRGDFFGGITAGIVALPLALAFGVQSGMGASAGLYGAIALGFFASLLGGTSTQVSGPTGPMTVISAALIARVVEQSGSLENSMGLVLLVFLAGGLFQMIFGLLGIGKYVRYIPYPVLSGFMSGIGVIIILLQLFPLIGLESPSRILDVVRELPDAISKCNYQALALGAGTIAFIYLIPKVTKAIPGTLLALIVFSLITLYAGLAMPLIGDIPSGLPKLQLGSMLHANLSQWKEIVFTGLTLAALGTIDSLLTSVVADNITHTKHNSRKELIGQGIGNMAAACVGGLPGAGATMRTMVNIKSGGSSRISGMIHSLLLLVILLGLGSTVAYIPLSVLAGILITVGIGILDVKGIKDLLKIPRTDAFIMVVVLILTVFVDLLQAVGLGMILASVLFMKRISDVVESASKVSESLPSDQEVPWHDELELHTTDFKQLYIMHLDGPVFFGAVSRLSALPAQVPDTVSVVIIRMARVPFIDQSGLYAFETAIQELDNRNVKVLLSMPNQQPRYLMEGINLIPGLIPKEYVFSQFEDCAEWVKNHFSH